MHFSKPFLSTVLSTSLLLLLPIVLSADPLFHFCSSQENYTANSPYANNLNELFSTLYTKVPPTGFGLGSAGNAPNRATGLALCRGDVSTQNCKTCVTDAGNEIMQRCPSNKAAIIWYDNCLFKYSNLDFFGVIDRRNRFYMYNVAEVDNPTSFNEKTKGLLSNLTSKAYVNDLLFATGELEMEGSQKLYGLVQCTRDLSGSSCKECLDGAISELPSCCDGKRGGRVVGGSCNFRYELYPFVNT